MSINMDTVEKLADDLGQIIFRIETNWNGFEAAVAEDNVFSRIQRRDAINRDIEKLKEIKGRIYGIC